MKDHVRARWSRAILVCRKCQKRDGQHGRQRLAKRLYAVFGGGKGRKAGVGVIEVDCLKVCPKGGIVVIDGARPGNWLIVPADASAEEVMRRLHLRHPGLEPGSRFLEFREDQRDPGSSPG